MDFDAAYDAYHALVLNRCKRLLADACDAEDAANEVWVRVWKYGARAAFVDRGHAEAWLMRVTRNVCLDHLRAARIRPVSVCVIGPRWSDTGSVEGMAALRERIRQIDAVIGGFTPVWQEVLACAARGEDWEESARVLGISIGTFKSRLFRARRELRKRVA